MTSRERQLATIRHELTDRISVDAIAVENAEAIAELTGLTLADVYPRLGIDGRVICANYTGTLSPGRDEWGVITGDDYGTLHQWPLANVSSVADVEKYRWPDPHAYDYRAAAALARSYADYAVRGPYWLPLFCRVCNLLGMEEAMVRMVTEPAVFEAVLEHVFSVTYEYCRRLLESCGDDLSILCLGDDFATQRGLMLSPESWRRFLKPRYAQLFALARQAGKPMWFHSCGDISAVLPDLIDIGLDVWETVQLHTLPFSARELKREYGKHLTFFGAVNTQRLPFLTPEQVRAEVLDCITLLGQGGGYICGPDHHVKPDVSAENTLALFDTATGFRGEGYTR